MFRWQDVVATLGIVALAILGGYLKALPDKLVTALVMAAVGYYAARTALARRDSKDASEAKDAKEEHKEQREDDKEQRERDDAIVEGRTDIQESGKIVVDPQRSGRTVTVDSDGHVVIGPAYQPQPEHPELEPFSETEGDRTPADKRKPTDKDDSEE